MFVFEDKSNGDNNYKLRSISFSSDFGFCPSFAPRPHMGSIARRFFSRHISLSLYIVSVGARSKLCNPLALPVS